LNSTESIEIMAEAMEKAFSDRAKYMGDPDFVKIPLAELLSKEHAEKIRQGMKIKPKGQVQGKLITGNFAPQESDQTTHLSVADKDGNLVALSQSVDAFFGSGVVVPGTGILLNDGMGDFSPEPGGPNSIAPGKRPLSNMAQPCGAQRPQALPGHRHARGDQDHLGNDSGSGEPHRSWLNAAGGD
jgi:gamma-glutamyltranspeptidase/glutathione hydrolase